MLGRRFPPTAAPATPPATHVSSQLPFLPSTGHSQLIWHRHRKRSRTAEHLLVPNQPSEPTPPPCKSPPLLPFCYWFSPFSGSLGFVSRCHPGRSQINRPLSHPNQHAQKSKEKKRKSQRNPHHPPPLPVLTFRAGRKEQAGMYFTGQEHL